MYNMLHYKLHVIMSAFFDKKINRRQSMAVRFFFGGLISKKLETSPVPQEGLFECLPVCWLNEQRLAFAFPSTVHTGKEISSGLTLPSPPPRWVFKDYFCRRDDLHTVPYEGDNFANSKLDNFSSIFKTT